MSLAMLLADASATDPALVGKIVGALGLTGALALAVYMLWGELKAERLAHAATRLDCKNELAAANAKLDAFQDQRIKEQGELIKALSAGGHA